MGSPRSGTSGTRSRRNTPTTGSLSRIRFLRPCAVISRYGRLGARARSPPRLLARRLARFFLLLLLLRGVGLQACMLDLCFLIMGVGLQARDWTNVSCVGAASKLARRGPMRLATTKKATTMATITTTMTTISSNTSTKAVTTQMRRRGGGKATEVARRSPVAFVGHVVGRTNLCAWSSTGGGRRTGGPDSGASFAEPDAGQIGAL